MADRYTTLYETLKGLLLAVEELPEEADKGQVNQLIVGLNQLRRDTLEGYSELAKHAEAPPHRYQMLLTAGDSLLLHLLQRLYA